MNITLNEASSILGITEDEVMFLHQTNELTAGINDENLTWEFALVDVLEQKAKAETKTNKEAADLESAEQKD